MTKSFAQIVASQYLRGLSDGTNPNGAREASGSCACYYLQGFDDARGVRKGLSEKAPIHIVSEDKDGKRTFADGASDEGLALLAVMRAAVESADEAIDARALYNRASQAVGAEIAKLA